MSCAVVEAVVAALLCFDGFPPMVKNEKEGEEEEERCLYFFCRLVTRCAAASSSVWMGPKLTLG